MIKNKFLLDKLLKTNTTDNTINLLAVKLYEEGRYADALDIFSKNIDIDLSHHMSSYYKGLCLFKTEKFMDSLIILTTLKDKVGEYMEIDIFITQCRNKLADDMQSYLIIMYHNYRHRKYDEILTYCWKILLIDPEQSKCYYIKGKVLECLKRHEEALECYNKCIDVDPYDHTKAYLRKGLLLERLRGPEEAQELWDITIQVYELNIEEDDEESHFSKPMFLLKAKRFEEALVSCNKGIADHPDEYRLNYYKAYVLSRLERYWEAFDNYNIFYSGIHAAGMRWVGQKRIDDCSRVFVDFCKILSDKLSVCEDEMNVARTHDIAARIIIGLRRVCILIYPIWVGRLEIYLEKSFIYEYLN
jgi:tetratricopeptide (TPR) repeat protein